MENKLKVFTNLNNRTRAHYLNLGYDISKKYIEVYIVDLPKGSNQIISINCDICSIELKVSNYEYNKRKNNNILYTCKKCSIEHKTKKTNLKKYGVESPLQNTKILNKVKETNLTRYGHQTALLNNVVKEKTKKTSLEKYGIECPAASQLSKEKRKITNILKYGVDNIFKTDEFKYSLLNNKIKNGFIIPSDELFYWRLYKNKVRSFTRESKNKLFENWNGYDYYDGKYIKNNFNLNSNNRNYPTIDHKLSIFYGFKNNILPIIIGNIDNLAITKRFLNSKKNTSIEN